MLGIEGNALWLGLAVLIGMPLVVVLLSESIVWARRSGYQDYVKPLTFLRNWVVPLGAISILLILADLARDSLLVRVMDTAFWIAVINSFLAFTNVFFFSDSDDATLRAKAPKLFLDILRFVFVLFGAAVVVSTVWGVNLAGLLTALGVGSVVIGLALQDTLGSIFSGIAMLSARQFKVGDWIRVGDKEGKVSAMTWRSVTIAARSGDIVVLPNTVLARERVINFGAANEWHSELVDFYFALDYPPERVKTVIADAARATPGVLHDPAPDARIMAFTKDSVHYQGRIFLPSYQPVPVARSDFQCQVWYHAQRAGLHFPARYDRIEGLPRHLAEPNYLTVEERQKLLNDVQATYGTLDELDDYLESARVLMFRAGEAVIQAGDVSDQALIVTAGTCKAMGRSSGQSLEDAVTLHEFTEGNVVIFKSLFRGEPTPLDVIADGDVQVLAFPRDVFEHYLAARPATARRVEQILSAREESAARMLKRADRVSGEVTMREQRIKMLQDMFAE